MSNLFSVVKLKENAQPPSLATDLSMAYDLRACLTDGDTLVSYTDNAKQQNVIVKSMPEFELMTSKRKKIYTEWDKIVPIIKEGNNITAYLCTVIEEPGVMVSRYEEGIALKNILSNSFGFGGNCSSLIFSLS